MKRAFVTVATALIGFSSTFALGATFARINPATDLGRVRFESMKSNGQGDFIALSYSRIFVGNHYLRTISEIVGDDRLSFILEGSVTINIPDRAVTVESSYFNTRVSINNQGDFVLASNTKLFVGNARNGSMGQVADAGAFADFQMVALNEAGQYVAVSAEKIFSGNVASANATQLIEEVPGTFEAYSIYVMGDNAYAAGIEQRLSLNANGGFIAVTPHAIYGGSVGNSSIELIHEERWLGFRHAHVDDTGAYVVISEEGVYAGNL